MTLAQIKSALRNGPYAFPGGYPLYFVTQSGDALDFDTVRTNLREVFSAHLFGPRDPDWYITAVQTNWEDPNLQCAHSNRAIPSAYGEAQ